MRIPAVRDRAPRADPLPSLARTRARVAYREHRMTDPSQLPGPHRVVSDDSMRRWRRRRRRLRRRMRRIGDVLLGVGAIVAVVLVVRAATGSSKQSPAVTVKPTGLAATHPPADDVQLTSCTYLNYASISGLRVTNHAGKQQTYYVEVTFTDGKKKYGQAIASTLRLPADKTVNLIATSLSTEDPPANLKCKVTRIERFG
jgi:hypothetical protein